MIKPSDSAIVTTSAGLVPHTHLTKKVHTMPTNNTPFSFPPSQRASCEPDDNCQEHVAAGPSDRLRDSSSYGSFRCPPTRSLAQASQTGKPDRGDDTGES